MSLNDVDAASSASQTVFLVDNFAHAKDVIKSLRSSSNSSRQYKQNAVLDNHIIENLDQFNNLVSEKAVVVSKARLLEDKMNESIANYKPPIRYIVPNKQQSNNGQIIYSPTTKSPQMSKANKSDNEDIDFSSDDEDKAPPQITSPNKMNPSNNPYDEEDDFGNELDDNSSDDEYQQHCGSSKSVKNNGTKTDLLKSALFSSKSSSDTFSPKEKSSFKNSKFYNAEEEAEENAELFMHFTAPVSSNSNTQNGNRKMSSGNSSNTNSVYNSTTGKTTKLNNTSINGGAKHSATTTVTDKPTKSSGNAGIRGIQELLQNSNNNNNTTRGMNENLLKSIKPGQAIRVKPPSKLRDRDNAVVGKAMNSSTFG